MNFKIVFKVLGSVLKLESYTLMLPLLVAVHYGENTRPFWLPLIVTYIVGFLLPK